MAFLNVHINESILTPLQIQLKGNTIVYIVDSLWPLAKSELLDDVNIRGRLLMDIKNSDGPRIEPCGIQEVGLIPLNLVLRIITNCVLPVR